MESVTMAVAETRESTDRRDSIGTVLALRPIRTLRNELAGTVQRVTLTPARSSRPDRARRPGCLGRRSRTEGARGAGRARGDAAGAACSDLIARTRHIRGGRRPGARRTRRRAGADRAHQSDHRAQDDSRAVPRARRHGGRASWPVPRRRHRAHDAAGRGRRRARRFRGRAARRRRPARRRHASTCSPQRDAKPIRATIVAVDARVDPATRNAMVRARIADRAHRAVRPGASVRVAVPGRAAAPPSPCP